MIVAQLQYTDTSAAQSISRRMLIVARHKTHMSSCDRWQLPHARPELFCNRRDRRRRLRLLPVNERKLILVFDDSIGSAKSNRVRLDLAEQYPYQFLKSDIPLDSYPSITYNCVLGNYLWGEKWKATETNPDGKDTSIVKGVSLFWRCQAMWRWYRIVTDHRRRLYKSLSLLPSQAIGVRKLYRSWCHVGDKHKCPNDIRRELRYGRVLVCIPTFQRKLFNDLWQDADVTERNY